MKLGKSLSSNPFGCAHGTYSVQLYDFDYTNVLFTQEVNKTQYNRSYGLFMSMNFWLHLLYPHSKPYHHLHMYVYPNEH